MLQDQDQDCRISVSTLERCRDQERGLEDNKSVIVPCCRMSTHTHTHTDRQWRSNGVSRVWAKSRGPRLQGPPSSRQKKYKKNNFPAAVKISISGYETLVCFIATLQTDLQIFGCDLHKNAFGGRAPPEHAMRATALRQTP